MKIRELTGYKANPIYQKAKEIFQPSLRDVKLDIMLDDFTKIMKQNGFHHLGTGSFGVVFEKEGYPWAFKVFKADPAYLKFFNFARKNQRNPHLPKVKGGLIKINNDTFAVRIEKLREMTNQEWNTYYNIIGTFQDIIADERTSEELEPDELALYKKYYDLYELIYIFWNSPSFSSYTLDFHQGNFMMRGNTLVISDPLVEHGAV